MDNPPGASCPGFSDSLETAFSSENYWDTAVEKGVNMVVCGPEEIGAMFQASTIFLSFFNAVLRQTNDPCWNYLGVTCTMCSLITHSSLE
jgi:hypothetical protein